MSKWKVALPLTVAVCFGAVIGFNVFKEYKIAEYLANMPEEENPVVVQKIEKTTWQPTIESVGFIEPDQGLEITSEVSGKIEKIYFESTKVIEQGEPLIQLNTDVERADLASINAKLNEASRNFKRIKELTEKGVASQKDFDEAQAKYSSLVAEKEGLEAKIKKMTIVAPFKGLVGIRKVSLGQQIDPTTPIVRLTDVDNMKIRFNLTQQDLGRLTKKPKVELHVDMYPDKVFVGEITSYNAALDKSTGTLEIEAKIPNNSRELLSGMYAEVSVMLDELEEQVVVPETAVAFNLYGESVYVVTDGKNKKGQPAKVAKLVNVTVGERAGNKALILEGLKAGDVVVTEGQIRLSNDALVKITEEGKLEQSKNIPML